jgi:protein involved in polysaccharide export with SLBB domain
MKGWLAMVAVAVLCSACATPNVVKVPSSAMVKERQIANFSPEQLPAPVLKVHPGDTLRIVRDAQTPAEKDEATLFVVRPDGLVSYPFIGTVKAAGRTPEDVALEIGARLEPIYRNPAVTINIAQAPGNRVYVGGAVRNPGAFDLNANVTVPQAITATGGVLPSADSHRVALVREDDAGVQQIYFFNYADMLKAANNGSTAIRLQRGDLVFVPSSRIGNAIQRVDMYVSQLLLFRGFGAAANYQINEPSYNVNNPYQVDQP